MQRRELFTSLFASKQREVIYPPYFKDEADFEKCKNCTQKPCVNACEENIIVIENEKPILDFSESGCTFCDECAAVCPEVLDIENKRLLPRLMIDPIVCVAWHGTICSSCRDACLDSAIKFYGLFKPEIKENCTGCGFCVGVCPSGAIRREGI